MKVTVLTAVSSNTASASRKATQCIQSTWIVLRPRWLFHPCCPPYELHGLWVAVAKIGAAQCTLTPQVGLPPWICMVVDTPDTTRCFHSGIKRNAARRTNEEPPWSQSWLHIGTICRFPSPGLKPIVLRGISLQILQPLYLIPVQYAVRDRQPRWCATPRHSAITGLKIATKRTYHGARHAVARSLPSSLRTRRILVEY